MMPKIIVFDIETYRPDWRIRRTRREDFAPSKNSIITVGTFDGKKISISPIVESLNEESDSVEHFLKKLKNFEGSTLVGYNILHFDIPYLVHKSESIGNKCNLVRFKPIDLFWILPYWLHNTSTGREFLDAKPHVGSLWKLEHVVKYILQEDPNPFSNKDVLTLWEMKRFTDIRKHLELDLFHTFSFFESPVIQEALESLRKKGHNKSYCKDTCPYRQLLQHTRHTASCFCALLQESISGEKQLSAIDTIDQPLPKWGISWIPHCWE